MHARHGLVLLAALVFAHQFALTLGFQGFQSHYLNTLCKTKQIHYWPPRSSAPSSSKQRACFERQEDADDLFDNGLDAQQRGELDIAENLFRASLEGSPANPKAYYQLGWINYLQRHQSFQRRLDATQNFYDSICLRPNYVYSDTRLILSDPINDLFGGRGCETCGDENQLQDLLDQFSAILTLEHDYTAEGVQARFQVHEGKRTAGPFYTTTNLIGSGAQPSHSCGLDVLINLFLLGFAVEEVVVKELLGSAFINVCDSLGLFQRSPGPDGGILLNSFVQVFPLDADVSHSDQPRNMLFFTDWPPPCATGLGEEPVMYVGPDSLGLVRHAPRKRVEKLLDLCCGSGIQGIVAAASGYASSVVCVDINPRAVRFARANALLNGVGARVTARRGDLYAGASSRGEGGGAGGGGGGIAGFGTVLANPPFIPVPTGVPYLQKRYDVFADGGPDGEAVLRRLVAGAAAGAGTGGGGGGAALRLVTELADAPEYARKIAAWLREEGGSAAGWRGAVLHTPPLGPGEYAARRAGPAQAWEAEVWRQHLEAQGIRSMAVGFVFLEKEADGVARQGGCGGRGREEDARVTVREVPGLWRPMAEEAVVEVQAICAEVFS